LTINEPVASDLSDKTATELGAIAASLMDKHSMIVPNHRVSHDVPSGSDGEPAPTVVPTAAESGLTNF